MFGCAVLGVVSGSAIISLEMRAGCFTLVV